MTTINLEPAWFVANVTAMKRKHPFTITRGATPFFGMHATSLTTSTAMLDAANQEERKEKIEELLLAKIKEQRLRESGGLEIIEGAEAPREIKIEDKSNTPHTDISPETKHILELVKLLHTKKMHEETKESLESLDKTISTLRDKIRVLTEEKHELVGNLKLVLNQEVAKRNQEEALLKAQQAAKQQQQQQQPFQMMTQPSMPMPAPTLLPTPAPLLYYTRPVDISPQYVPPVGIPAQLAAGPLINSQNPSPLHPNPSYGSSDRGRLFNSGDAESYHSMNQHPGRSSQPNKESYMDLESPAPSPIDGRSLNHRQHISGPAPPYGSLSYDRDRDRDYNRDRDRSRDRDRDQRTDRYTPPARNFQSPEPRRDEPWRGRGGSTHSGGGGRHEPYPSSTASSSYSSASSYDRGRGGYRGGGGGGGTSYGSGGGSYHSTSSSSSYRGSGNGPSGGWRGGGVSRGGSSTYRGSY